MKGVFTTRIDPSYDDLPETRYHFPKTYLRQVRETIGDLIVYYEPGRTGKGHRRDGRLAYFAVAEVVDVVPDDSREDHFYALMRNYLDFDNVVPFREGGVTRETSLLKSDGSINRGAFGRAVRNIPDQEFEAILAAGFRSEMLDFVPDPVENEYRSFAFEEPAADFERPIVETTLKRAFRDRTFRRHVRTAYDRRCSFTGLRILNGGGRPEVQAAHIRPVQHQGPDSIRNGLALASTIQWMFDRGLVSLSDNFEILVASNGLPEGVANLLNDDRRAIVPAAEKDRPHKQFLEFHRDTIFKR